MRIAAALLAALAALLTASAAQAAEVGVRPVECPDLVRLLKAQTRLMSEDLANGAYDPEEAEAVMRMADSQPAPNVHELTYPNFAFRGWRDVEKAALACWDRRKGHPVDLETTVAVDQASAIVLVTDPTVLHHALDALLVERATGVNGPITRSAVRLGPVADESLDPDYHSSLNRRGDLWPGLFGLHIQVMQFDYICLREPHQFAEVTAALGYGPADLAAHPSRRSEIEPGANPLEVAFLDAEMDWIRTKCGKT